MDINRKKVETGDQFVWIPTGHMFGVPSGIVGWWDGSMEGTRGLVEFPESEKPLKVNPPFYEPTDAEVDEMLADSERWAERFDSDLNPTGAGSWSSRRSKGNVREGKVAVRSCGERSR